MEAEEDGNHKINADEKSAEELTQSDPPEDDGAERMDDEESTAVVENDVEDGEIDAVQPDVETDENNIEEAGELLEGEKENSTQEEQEEGDAGEEETIEDALTQEIDDPEEMEEGEHEEEEDEDNGTRPRQPDSDDIDEAEEGELEIDEGEDNGTVEKTVEETRQKEASTGSLLTRKRTLSQSSGEDGPKRKVGRNVGGRTQPSDGAKHDKYCWVCHKDGVQVNCKLCPRSYHTKCMSMDYPNAKIGQGDSTCPCPECVVVMNAETLEFRSDAMKQLTLDQLMGLLKNVCLRMRQTPGSEPFVQPVDPNEAEDYFDYIVYAMDIETLEKNIKKRLYGSTEGFLADAQWLVHNSIVFNSASSQYSLHAKRLLKVCKQELAEIETCPECYTNAYDQQDDWFLQACRRPHILVWAKLKGFPFWPAKAVRVNNNEVDVRFFGQHDRAWVAMKDCYLYSEEMPVAPPKKNGPLLGAVEELNAHVEKLKEVHGPIQFATVKTQIGPQINTEQIRRMLPEYNPPEQATKAQSTAASTVKTNPNTNNNNNNNAKTPQPQKKSPMTIRISSLKTNPTIVNNSAVSVDEGIGASTEGRVVTRVTRKSSAATQQSQSAGVSESDHSVDEHQGSEANSVEDENNADERVPDNANGTDDETEATSVPKGSEILANALGGPLRRSTRGMSRSGDSSTHAAEPGTPNTNEKRLTRSSLKGSAADAGNETDESSGQAGEEQPPDSVLEAMGLSKKTKESVSNQRSLQIKGEPSDHFNDTDCDQLEMTKTSNKNSHVLVEQLSAHSTVKPGYRFNLSKDISISAVDGGGGGDQSEDFEGTNSALAAANFKVKRAPSIMGQNQRGVPQAIPMNVAGGVRARMQANNASILNGQPQQRMFTGQQLRQMVRNARPQHILNPRTGQTVRIAGAAAGNRPVGYLNMRGQQQPQQIVHKATKDTSVNVDSSLVSPVQGPITLPGGNITVTPLTSLINAGVPITAFEGQHAAQAGQHVAVSLKNSPSTSSLLNVQQQGGGSTVMIGSSAGKSIKGVITTTQQRRNLMASIPPSVSLHLQQLTKTMGDLVKSTVEQITLEVIEHCNNTQGKAEATRLQVEVDRLQKQLKQEVTDVKHNNDIALRELRITMDNDKKRAIAEMKRQMETEKQKAIEETKKKQWCASCGREALFYCCWNTSYCGYPCQEEHWPTHMSSCSQGSTNSR